MELKGVLSGGTGVGQRWAVVGLGSSSWECSMVKLGPGGAAVGRGGTTERWDTERNYTNTCTHLQVGHRNKLYKYIAETNCTNTNTNTKTKAVQTQIQQNSNYSIPIQHQLKSQYCAISMPIQSKLNSITITDTNQTQLNQTCTSPLNVTDECEVCAENECLQIKTNRNKL